MGSVGRKGSMEEVLILTILSSPRVCKMRCPSLQAFHVQASDSFDRRPTLAICLPYAHP